ncbi:MAG: hypothetical protein J6V40_04795 [Clostridia bacterium]|nr:hypothetical protein [Clostridia bacterium]
MTRLKKVSAYILCLMLSVLVLSGCSITEFLAGLFQDKPTQLAAPVLTLNETNETLNWVAVDNATAYMVYIQGEYTPRYEMESNRQPSFSLAIEEVVDESGEYAFYVIATSSDKNYTDSIASNIITYEYILLERLDAPTITIDRENTTISWSSVDYADSYKIYLNGVLLDEVAATITTYNFSDSVTEYGVYRFQVSAVGDTLNYKESKLSNGQKYFYTELDIVEIDETDLVVNNTAYTINATINAGIITWDEVANTDTYVIVAYENDLEYIATTITTNSFELEDIAIDDGIYAIRVAVEDGGKLYLDNDIYYYNTAPSSDFTTKQKIYAFDGKINDYYIENYDELCNIAYYQFILRNEDFTIRFSDEYLAEIQQDARFSNKTKLIDKVNQLLEYAYNSFMETCYYNYGNGYSYANKIQGSTTDYRIRLDFFDVLECDTTIEPIEVYEQKEYTPYYENYVGTPRGNYFASDYRYISTYVTTTEELFWAVTYGYTPLFTSDTCRAKIVYDMAKEVLKEIIFVEMTDYEKALAIFDWISLNTAYDHSEYNCDPEEDGYYYTDLPGFYMEGVFITGNSVCDGFAKAYAMMCNMEDIDCIRVVGTVSGSGHAWNKVKLGDEWYVVDITWTETVLADEEIFFHTYFLVSDTFISTHKDYPYRETYEEYPATKMYNHFGNYVYTYNSVEYDHVITSDEEFEVLFHYALDNNITSLEFVVDCTTYLATGTMEDRLTLAFAAMKAEKFPSQYLNLIRWNTYKLTTYADGKQGILFTTTITLLIDSITESAQAGTKNEVQYIIDYAIDKELSYEGILYVDKELMESFVTAGTTLEQAFAAFVEEYNVNDTEFNYTVTALDDEAVVYGTDEDVYGNIVEEHYGYLFNIVINPTA